MYKLILQEDLLVEYIKNLIKNNIAYLLWFAFYFLLFSILTGGIMAFLYIITVLLALTPASENIWRMVEGVRPLRLKSEKERLLPLFKEVYQGAVGANPKLSKSIKLYIKEDMSINAFAFGKSTLVLTRGSIELLNDECLKGLIAHEFGHFSHRHTEALLLFTVANLPMTFIIKKLTNIKTRINNRENRGSIITSTFIGLYDILYYFFKAIDSVGALILMHSSRRNEYTADAFSIKSGFAQNLTDVLIEIYSASITKPQSVKEQLRSTHPHITKRIERLEAVIY